MDGNKSSTNFSSLPVGNYEWVEGEYSREFGGVFLLFKATANSVPLVEFSGSDDVFLNTTSSVSKNFVVNPDLSIDFSGLFTVIANMGFDKDYVSSISLNAGASSTTSRADALSFDATTKDFIVDYTFVSANKLRATVASRTENSEGDVLTIWSVDFYEYTP